MRNFQELELLFERVNDSGVRYMVTGGVALDAHPLRSCLTRPHGDVNIVVAETDIRAFKEGLGKDFTWHTKVFFPQAEMNGLTVELWPYMLAQCPGDDGSVSEFYVINGEKSTRWYPEALLEGQKGAIRSLEFTIASDEQLYYDGLHKAGDMKQHADVPILDALAARMDRKLYDAIKDIPRQP